MSPALFLFLMVAVGFVAYTLAIPAYSSTGSTIVQQDFDYDKGGEDIDDDDTSIDHSVTNDPAFIDGTAMSGTYDTYGVAQSHHDSLIDHADTDHMSFDDDPFEHTTKVGCSLICGDIDMHGDPCGVTDWESDSWGSCDISSSSMFD